MEVSSSANGAASCQHVVCHEAGCCGEASRERREASIRSRFFCDATRSGTRLCAAESEPPLVFHYTLSGVLLPFRNSAPPPTRRPNVLHDCLVVSTQKSVNSIALSSGPNVRFC